LQISCCFPPAKPPGEQPMQRTLLRIMVITLTVFLPGCLVITCGP
jgi:hypothetical protein